MLVAAEYLQVLLGNYANQQAEPVRGDLPDLDLLGTTELGQKLR